jgi:small GTP-binding protein
MTQEITNIKVVIYGSSGAGKTSLAKAICTDEFKLNKSETSTVGVEYFKLTSKNNTHIAIWDIAGRVPNNSILPICFKVTQIVLYCIDFSKDLDKEDIIKKYVDINKYAKNAKIIFVGTKSKDNDKTEQLKNIILDQKIDVATAVFCNVDVEFSTGIQDLKEKINQIGIKKQQQALDDKLYHNGLFTDASNTLINLVKDRFPHQDTNKNSPQCEKIREALEDLQIKLKPTNANIEVNIDKATNEFYQECYKVLGPSRKTQIGKAILAVGAAVSLLVVSGLIGFCIGLGLGGWTGPGAIVPALVGLGIGLLSGSGASITALGASKLLLFKPNEEMKQVDEVMEKAKNFKP